MSGDEPERKRPISASHATQSPRAGAGGSQIGPLANWPLGPLNGPIRSHVEAAACGRAPVRRLSSERNSATIPRPCPLATARRPAHLAPAAGQLGRRKQAANGARAGGPAGGLRTEESISSGSIIGRRPSRQSSLFAASSSSLLVPLPTVPLPAPLPAPLPPPPRSSGSPIAMFSYHKRALRPNKLLWGATQLLA